MELNYWILFVAAIIPMLVGAIYYHPKVVGGAWMKANKFTDEDVAGGNMLVIFGVSYLLSFFLAFALVGVVLHQWGVFQLFAMDTTLETVGSDTQILFQQIMDKFGNTHRSFGHGALHGSISTITLALPLIAINALFERRGFKYILIHFVYWLITITLMGGVICQFI